ncbi:unnamed protein product [Litomosoides sigmodontis]|uniref:Uncharacterized protein n=1 Tax=Litomosoides sigmodontis TaxID=42156 RepID=A0A3P6STU3_LITSI|nr:unnamed protein product [Litomosoides sigmodontis]
MDWWVVGGTSLTHAVDAVHPPTPFVSWFFCCEHPRPGGHWTLNCVRRHVVFLISYANRDEGRMTLSSPSFVHVLS